MARIGRPGKEWIHPNDWVDRYGEIISKANAARLIGRSAAFITKRIVDGTFREYTTGISVRQLAEYELGHRVVE